MQNQTKDHRSGWKRKHDSQRPLQKDKHRIGKENKVPKGSPKKEAMDKEIDEMAKKIKLDNERKMAHAQNFSIALNVPPVLKPPPPQSKTDDLSSVQGQFGWTEIARTTIPYLLRSGEKYVSLRMVDNGILFKFKNLFTDEVHNCFRIKVFPVSPAEAHLLNEINFRHCDNFYGKVEFTVADTILSLKDLVELYGFLNFCYLKLIEKAAVPQNRCGFIKISGQNCVPYVWHDQKMYAPLFYFEGECASLEATSVALTGWDLAYLKLYCKIQGIRKSLYEEETLRVVEFELLKTFFPTDTPFEESWPEHCKIDDLLQRPAFKVVLSQAQNVKNKEDGGNPQEGVTVASTSQSADAAAAQSKLRHIRPRPKPAPTPVSSAHSQQVPPQEHRAPPPQKTNAVGTAGGAPIQHAHNYQRSHSPNNAAVQWRQFQLVGTYPRGSNVLQIPDVGYANAYFVIKFQVEGRMLHYCINLEPFVTTILLVTLEESAMFFRLPVEVVASAVNALRLDIFLPNTPQKRELEKYRVYSTRGMLRLMEFVDHLPQLRYILKARPVN